MRILFIAPTYQRLYLPILNQMESDGHSVLFLEDKVIVGDHYRRASSKIWELYRRIKRWYSTRRYVYEKYWESVIGTTPELSSAFDVLFVVNGCSFHPFLLEHLRNFNKNIDSVLYLWDTEKYYHYFRNSPYFNRVFTFDLNDSIKYKASFLPFYWTDCNEPVSNKIKISIVGSNHDGRFSIVSKVSKFLDNAGISNYKFLILSERRNLYPVEKVKRLLAILSGDRSTVNDYDIISGKLQSDLIITEQVPYQEVNSIINNSEFVLDTDREDQTGTTPRVIWALAKGKKLFSTNRNLKRMPFYSPEQISIFNRQNPVLDLDFLNNETDGSFVNEYIQNLRLDLWLEQLLDSGKQRATSNF